MLAVTDFTMALTERFMWGESLNILQSMHKYGDYEHLIICDSQLNADNYRVPILKTHALLRGRIQWSEDQGQMTQLQWSFNKFQWPHTNVLK